MSLQVLAYNMNRMINIFGVNPAHASDRRLTARVCRRELPLSRNTRIGNHVFTRPWSNLPVRRTVGERPVFVIAVAHPIVFMAVSSQRSPSQARAIGLDTIGSKLPELRNLRH